MNNSRDMKAFTLAEVLASIAIIAITAAIVFSVIAKARGQVDEAPCVSNLRQLGVAIELYRQDSNGEYPLMLSNLVQVDPQVVPVLKCPSDPTLGANATDSARLGHKVSIFYWMPYPEGYRSAVTAADQNPGVAYCVLHGKALRSNTTPDIRMDTTGLVLRLLADGSVHRANVGFHCGDLPNGSKLEFRTEWSLLTDAACTDRQYCQASPTPCKDPRE